MMRPAKWSLNATISRFRLDAVAIAVRSDADGCGEAVQSLRDAVDSGQFGFKGCSDRRAAHHRSWGRSQKTRRREVPEAREEREVGPSTE